MNRPSGGPWLLERFAIRAFFTEEMNPEEEEERVPPWADPNASDLSCSCHCFSHFSITSSMKIISSVII